MEAEAVCTECPPRTFVAAVLAPMVSTDPAMLESVMSPARRLSMFVVSDQKALMTA